MSGFNGLAVRLARSRRRLERERAAADTVRTGARQEGPRQEGPHDEGPHDEGPREVARLAAVIAATVPKPGTTNVIQFPRR